MHPIVQFDDGFCFKSQRVNISRVNPKGHTASHALAQSKPQSANVECTDAQSKNLESVVYTTYKPLRCTNTPYRPPKVNDYALNDILKASIREETDKNWLKREEKFNDWLDHYQSMGNFVPTWKDLIQGKDVIFWINIVGEYLVEVFNETHNVGKTIAGHLDALLYAWSLKHLHLVRKDFPWLRRFTKGCNVIAQRDFGKKINIPKFAILNPQLEVFLKHTIDPHVRMAMLLQHRFVLRAEHYSFTKVGKSFLAKLVPTNKSHNCQ